MSKFFAVLKKIFKDKDLRKKSLIVLGLFLVFRFLAHVPVSGVNVNQLKALFDQNQFLGLINLLGGGTLANFSVLAVGIGPYIYASIVMQLGAQIYPKLEELQKEGEYGKQKINQYTRYITLPLGILQSIGMYALLRSQGLISELNPFFLITFIATLVAGTMLLLWIGELISEQNIGNGISLIIFAGIVGTLPTGIVQVLLSATPEQYLNYALIGAAGILLVGAIVFVTEAVRKVPVIYARRIRGGKSESAQQTFLPLRLNSAGVVPIIFVISLVLFPSLLANYFLASKAPALVGIGQFLAVNFATTSIAYNVVYFLMVFGFTYFYTAIVINPQKVAEDIQEGGGFIPGIRPGKPTAGYLNYIVTRITLAGGLFLGIVAVLPNILQSLTGIQALLVGGTSVLIVVSVVIETVKIFQTQLVTRSYERFNL
jgi:preprotein translocase subunit SecY